MTETTDTGGPNEIPPAILFDMDGVVLEGRGTDPSVYERAADAAVESLGVEPTDDQLAGLRAHGYDAVEGHCETLGVDPTEFWRLKERFASEISSGRLQSGRRGVYADADVIRSIASETTTALVSNNRHETVEFVADYFRFPFDAVRGRDPTPAGFRRRKPDPAYLLETLDALDVDDGIYVGDRETDVVAAERAGLEAAYLRRPHNRTRPLPEGSTYELHSLEELLGIVGAAHPS